MLSRVAVEGKPPVLHSIRSLRFISLQTKLSLAASMFESGNKIRLRRLSSCGGLIILFRPRPNLREFQLPTNWTGLKCNAMQRNAMQCNAMQCNEMVGFERSHCCYLGFHLSAPICMQARLNELAVSLEPFRFKLTHSQDWNSNSNFNSKH